MHHAWTVVGSLLGGLALGLAGCVGAGPHDGEIRQVYVQEASGVTAHGLPAYDAVIHDTAVRVLTARGYVAALESAAADAWLRPAWVFRSPATGADGAKVSLRLTLERKDGLVLRTFTIIEAVPAHFLSPERVADEVRGRLGTINRGPTAAP